ncbi:uncharacterized protein LOC117208792 [Bombus bifarius]|uniref:Uncharacterized protein LOC117208792 n=1 Tax=Bombus bifarius TaxID=103933 RepID=A0A6P8LY52_9HYME|nr:uncharacterized protein LOC117208792 [Bombus bifarius]
MGKILRNFGTVSMTLSYLAVVFVHEDRAVEGERESCSLERTFTRGFLADSTQFSCEHPYRKGGAAGAADNNALFTDSSLCYETLIASSSTYPRGSKMYRRRRNGTSYAFEKKKDEKTC